MAENSDVVRSEQVLDCPMEPNDTDAATVRDYLKNLLTTLWREGEGFSGKRPFGNSSWEYELYIALGKAGLIDITLDSGGYVEEVDDEAADRLIFAAIGAL